MLTQTATIRDSPVYTRGNLSKRALKAVAWYCLLLVCALCILPLYSKDSTSTPKRENVILYSPQDVTVDIPVKLDKQLPLSTIHIHLTEDLLEEIPLQQTTVSLSSFHSRKR
jgi:hypothetical protein